MKAFPSPLRLPPRRLSATSLALLVAGVAAGSLGCDTVAEISFDIRKYEKTVSPGITQVGATCNQGDSTAQMRFILQDQSGKVIRPGDQLTEGALSVTSDNVVVSESRLDAVPAGHLVRCDADAVDEEGMPDYSGCASAGYDFCAPIDPAVDTVGVEFTTTSIPVDDIGFCRQSCADDSECDRGVCAEGGFCTFEAYGDFCSGDSDCTSGEFSCTPYEDGGSESFCSIEGFNTIVTPGSLEFISPPSNDELRAITLLMDNSGSVNGKGVVESDSTVRLNRSTDPNDARIAAAKLFFLQIQNKPFRASTIYSVWGFRGETAAGVRAITGNQQGNPFVVNPAVANGAIEQISADSGFGRSNVFIALETVADNAIDNNISASRDFSIILFTDGPDDAVVVPPDADAALREAAVQQWRDNFNNALSSLQAAGATVHIVHLDTAIGPDGLAELTPDPQNAMPFERDANGRFGPIDEYAQIACATGGNYLYVRDPRGLSDQFDVLSDTVDGTWKVDVNLEALSRPGVPAGPYRFQGTLTVNADNASDSYFYDPLGDESTFGQLDQDDSRALIFKRTGEPNTQ